jgi:hypothetical protein
VIPDHLAPFTFNPSTFYRMKNKKVINYGINDDGITELARQAHVVGQRATTEHLASTEKRIVVTVKVSLRLANGSTWEAVASAASTEFDMNDWDDRRKYHLAQMAMTRAKNNAVLSAIGATNADINMIAEHLGIKGDDKTRTYEDHGPEPDVPDEPEESEEEKKKQTDEMRKRMLNAMKRSG